MFYLFEVLFIVENFLCVYSEFVPFIAAALFAEINVFPGPENFDFFDMIKDISDVDIKQRLLVFDNSFFC